MTNTLYEFNNSYETSAYRQNASATSNKVWLLLLILFAVDLIFQRVLNVESRILQNNFLNVLRTGTYTLLVAGGLVSLVTSRKRLHAPSRKLSLAIYLFILSIAISLILGSGQDVETRYVIGDFAKYMIYVGTIILAITGPTQPFTQRLMVRNFILIYLVNIIFLLVTMSSIYGFNMRPTSVYTFPVFALFILSMQNKRGKLIINLILTIIILLAFTFIVYRSQSLSLIISTIFLISTYYLLRANKIKVIAFVAILALSALLFNILKFPYFGELDAGVGNSYYLINKFNFLSEQLNFSKAVIHLSGNRVLFYFALFHENNNIADWLFGHGFGTMIGFSGIQVRGLIEEKELYSARHFFENGYSEILWRSGIFGLSTFITIFLLSLVRAFQLYKNSTGVTARIYLACTSYLLYLIIFSSFSLGFPIEAENSPAIIGMVLLIVWSSTSSVPRRRLGSLH